MSDARERSLTGRPPEASSGPPANRRELWRRAAEGLALLAVSYFVARYLAAHWSEIRSHSWELALPPLLGASVLAAAALVLFGTLWTGLLQAAGEPIGLRRGLSMWFLSNLARYVPGKIWQLSGVAYLARRGAIDPLQAVGASLLLQLLVIEIGLLLLILTLPAEIAELYGRPTRLGIVCAAGVLLVLALSPIFDAVYARALSLLGQPPPLGRMPLGRKLLFAGGTLAGWALYAASFWLFLKGTVGRPPPLATSAGIFVAGYLAGYLAFFTPGGLGVREGAFALLLQPYLPASVALAAAVLSRLWLTSLEVALASLSVTLAHPAAAERTRLELGAPFDG